MDIKVPHSKDMKPFNVSPALGRFSFFWAYLLKDIHCQEELEAIVQCWLFTAVIFLRVSKV